MMTSNFIINVTETDFEYEVVNFSQNIPVLAAFLAAWSQPGRELSGLLERLVMESGGAFRLAKVDVDHSQNLALLYGVRSVPTVKAFSQGRVVAEFAGNQPENRVREFMEHITPPSGVNLAMEKANSLLDMHDWEQAEILFRDLLNTNPDQTEGLLGLAKTLLAKGEPHEARYILNNFPASRQFPQAKILLPYAETLIEYKDKTLPDDTDLDAIFHNSIRLAARGNLPAALDGLLDVLRQNRDYRDDRARLVILSLLDLMGDQHPDSRRYRQELASVLF
ncbi:MAG: tetratricopeptide repeat protein [Anaerolineaceae bacterium]|jgi:putative thioredoxin|nr:tetratricopeptide repeat protein [Anaerolineaceae bacterium]